MLYATYTLGACLLLCEVSQEVFRDILEFLQRGYKSCMNWRLDLMHSNLLLLGFYRTFLSLIRLQMTLIHLTNHWTQVDLRLATLKNMWIRVKRNTELLFIISEANFTKTAIKPKFFDRSSLKIIRSANNQCTIQSPNFALLIYLFYL